MQDEIERLERQVIDGLKPYGLGLMADDKRNYHIVVIENTPAHREIERLRAALRECANDLECELNGRYDQTLDYPSQRAKFDRDMQPVLAARKLLNSERP